MDAFTKETEMTEMNTYDALEAKANELKAMFPGVTFGYIGNCGVDRSGKFDDRSWYIFLPHPGRIGTYVDNIGGYRTASLNNMLKDWDKLVELVAKRMVGR